MTVHVWNLPYKEFRIKVLEILATEEKGKMDRVAHYIDKYLRKHFKIYTIRNEDKTEMWIYFDGIYNSEGKTYIKERCKKILGIAYTSHMIGRVITKIEADTFINQDKFFETGDINKIPVLNGVLDIITRDLEPFNPKYRFFSKINANYDPSKKCPLMIKFLSDIMDKKSIDIIQELLGYLLYKSYKFPKAFLFYGVGRNGKSTLIEIIKRFIGVENCSGIGLDALSNNSFAMAELHRKLANINADLSTTDIKRTGSFKQLTGGDPVHADRKHRSRVKFTNYAKLIFCANKFPTVRGATEAFYSRWVIVNFPYRFYTEKEIQMMSEKGEDVTDVKKVDRDILDNIFPNEASGILNWALDGLDRLMKKKNFSHSKIASDIETEYQMKSDSFSFFCDKYLELGDYEYDRILKSELRKKYKDFCRKKRLFSNGDKHIMNTLKEKFCTYSKQFGDGKMYWTGIRYNVIVSKNSKLK